MYLKEKLEAGDIGVDYIPVAPELIVKINFPADDNQVPEDEHLFVKIQRLLNFGTKKVIWVFPKTRMVLVAQPAAPWQMYPWASDLELLDDVVYNIDMYCREAGLQI